MGEPIRKIKDTVKTIQKARMDICIRKLPHLKILYKLKNKNKNVSESTHFEKSLNCQIILLMKSNFNLSIL